MPSSPFLNPDDPKKPIEMIIKIGLLALLIIYCFMIIQPFIVIIIWALIIAIALYPLYSLLEKKMHSISRKLVGSKGEEKLT